MVEIICLVISSIALVAIIALFIFVIKTNKKTNTSNVNDKDLGVLAEKIDNSSVRNKDFIETAVAKEMAKLYESVGKASETNNEKLERFQKNITDSLLNRFDALNQQMNDKLVEMNKKVDDKLQEGFKGTSETMAQVRERLQAIDDAQKNIQKLSTDVVSLKQVLEGNQTRGQYGEYQLSVVLHNVFGDVKGGYEEQYTMHKVKDGDDVRADAVVFMPEPNHMICIDSKFPFQNYARTFDAETPEEKEELLKQFNNDVKKHITVIADKYIVENKTAPNAIMFIPNDGIFAFIHHNSDEIVGYARSKGVIITSPSTLPPILVTINMARIENERSKNVQIISKQLSMLGKQFEIFARDWDSFSRQLETASKTRERLDSRVNKITGRFESIRGNQIEEDKIEELSLEDNDNE